MTKSDGDDGDAAEGRRNRSGSKAPTDRPDQILIAYAGSGNAAAVARELGTNERTVRRLVQQFPTRLDEFRRERDQGRRERADAREARLQELVDPLLDASLTRLQSLVGSDKDSTALAAIKLTVNLALRVPPATHAPTELDRAVAEEEARAAHLLLRLETDQDGDGHDA